MEMADDIEYIDIIEGIDKIESIRKNIESVKDGGYRKYMNSAPKVLYKTFGALFLDMIGIVIILCWHVFLLGIVACVLHHGCR